MFVFLSNYQHHINKRPLHDNDTKLQTSRPRTSGPTYINVSLEPDIAFRLENTLRGQDSHDTLNNVTRAIPRLTADTTSGCIINGTLYGFSNSINCV